MLTPALASTFPTTSPTPKPTVSQGSSLRPGTSRASARLRCSTPRPPSPTKGIYRQQRLKPRPALHPLLDGRAPQTPFTQTPHPAPTATLTIATPTLSRCQQQRHRTSGGAHACGQIVPKFGRQVNHRLGTPRAGDPVLRTRALGNRARDPATTAPTPATHRPGDLRTGTPAPPEPGPPNPSPNHTTATTVPTNQPTLTPHTRNPEPLLRALNSQSRLPVARIDGPSELAPQPSDNPTPLPVPRRSTLPPSTDVAYRKLTGPNTTGPTPRNRISRWTEIIPTGRPRSPAEDSNPSTQGCKSDTAFPGRP